MKLRPVALFGLPLYEQEEHLTEALESLLAQTREDFALYVTDDSASEGPGQIVRRFAAVDPRVHYERNPYRLGMVANWRRAFTVATRTHPDARYFAWASDHDIWHPRWLETLLELLEDHPESVAAYPRNFRIDAAGAVIREPWTYSTGAAAKALDRARSASRGMSAGDMVYGLFTVDALRRAGIFRAVPLPDRLLLTEVALLGELVQASDILWYRRMISPPFRIERQRASFFVDRVPLHSRLPWPLLHASILVWDLVVKRRLAPQVSPTTGLRVAGSVLASTSWPILSRRMRIRARGPGIRFLRR